MKIHSRRPGRLVRSLAAMLALSPFALAQSQTDYEKRYDEKLSHDFIEFGGWSTDYDAARALAKKEGKVLFVYFSRSYAP